MSDTVDTYTWDTVFAIHFDKANAAIVSQKSTPKTFSFTDATTGYAFSGSWDDWQLVPGGGAQNLHMRCPITSGKGTLSGSSDLDLDESWIVIEIQLNQIPDPEDRLADPTAKTSTGKTFLFVPKTTGTETDPAVSVVSYDFPHVSGFALEALPEIFAKYLCDNLNLFNNVFAIFRLGETADVGAMQWLKPTAASYACQDAATNPSAATSGFAVLSMTENRPISAQAQQNLDLTIFEGLSAYENAAFAISGERFVEKLLIPAAVSTIAGSQASDFSISNDGLTVTNKNDITWGGFTLENGDTVSPVIPKGNFELSMFQQQIEFSIEGMHFKWPKWHGPGDINVSMSFCQYIGISLTALTTGPNAGKSALLPINNDQPTITANVTVSKGVEIFDICVGIAGSIAGAILGGVLAAGFDAAGAVTAESAEEGTIEVTSEAIEESEEEAGEQAVADAEEEASSEAAEAIAEPGKWQKFSNAIRANKWKIFGSTVGTALGMQPGLIGDYMKLAAQNATEDLPPFDSFAANCVESIQFSDTSTWNLKSAQLNGALVMGGRLD